MVMTHKDFKRVREELGLSVSDAAQVLGCSRVHIMRVQSPPGGETHRGVSAAIERLLQAYLDGYRPRDWPLEK